MNHYRPNLVRNHPDYGRCGDGNDLSATDSLFAMLDGQVIRGRAGAWRAEVVSILNEQDATWVQIAPARKPAVSVLLRMDDERRGDAALDALRAWTDLPEEHRPVVIEVAEVADAR